MGSQQSIKNISRLGLCLSIDIDNEGLIVAGVYTKPLPPSGMQRTVLEPANEIGHDLDEVLANIERRLDQCMAKEKRSNV